MTTTPQHRPVMRAPASLCPESGFSIVELMVTVTITAILSAIAIPAMRAFMQNDRMWGEQNTLVMTLNQARSEAIKGDIGTGVTVCASSDGLTCNTANWSSGWIVPNPQDATKPPLASVPAMPTTNTVKELGGNSQIIFLSNGTVQNQVTGRFVFCDQRLGTFARYTEVAGFGRIVSAPSASLGKDLNGVALTCP